MSPLISSSVTSTEQGTGSHEDDPADLSVTRRAVQGLPDMLRRMRAHGDEHFALAGPKIDPGAALTAEDAMAVYQPNQDEFSALLEELRTTLQTDSELHAAQLSPQMVDPFFVNAALYARKGDMKRAQALLRNYLLWRKRLDADNVHPASSSALREQLRSGLMLSPGTRDRCGRAVVYMRLRLNQPDRYSALDTIRLASVVLEWTLRTYPYARTHGIAFFQDLRDVRFRNMDFRVPREMRNAFAQTLPIRCGSMNVLNPPMFLRVIFAVVNKMFSEKMKTRVNVVANSQSLLRNIDPDQILKDTCLGGLLEWDEQMHALWCDRVESDFVAWSSKPKLPSVR